jgi:hypothetical protein
VPVNAPGVGDTVRLVTPDNPRLDGAAATVSLVTDWGALVLTDAAGSGQYRALWSELEALEPAAVGAKAAHANGHASRARDEGYSGDVCDQCGSARMKRNGPCLLCCECGATSGCS